MLLTFYFPLIFHLALYAVSLLLPLSLYHSFALFCRSPSLSLYHSFALLCLALSQLIQWKVHDMAVFWLCLLLAFCCLHLTLCWLRWRLMLVLYSPPRHRARTTPINKFIALINNCNTVADCSLNGNGFMKYTVLAGIAFLYPSSPSIAFQVSFGKVLSNYARIFNKLISHILTLGIFSKGSPSLPAPPFSLLGPSMRSGIMKCK